MSYPPELACSRSLLGTGVWLGRDVLAANGGDEEVAQVQAQAQKAGLGVFRSSVTEHYLGIGDAPDGHRNDALKLCEALAAAFLDTIFAKRGSR